MFKYPKERSQHRKDQQQQKREQAKKNQVVVYHHPAIKISTWNAKALVTLLAD